MNTMTEKSNDECYDIVYAQRLIFRTGKTRSYDFRLKNLKGVRKFLVEREKEIVSAFETDLGRGVYETVSFDVLPSISEVDHMISHLKSYMKPTLVSSPASMLPATSSILPDPLGVCLIISPFNYPLSLAIIPLVGAIAAGNTVVVKPSELAVATATLLAKFLPEYIDKECFQVVNGGVETTKALLSQKWDKIFFTGSCRVGKIVMHAAADNLTPVTLELGGKSPTIVDETSNLEVAAKRIVWGKFINAGQTCIAPDYVLCNSKIYEQFIVLLKAAVINFYTEYPQSSAGFARIINSASTERLKGILASECDQVVVGGACDVPNRYVAPTIVRDVKLGSKLLNEELFGPILPVCKFESIEEVINTVREVDDKPLVMYIFSRNQSTIDTLVSSLQSGACVINDTIFHVANSSLPFGGVGSSGMGGYHGKFSFDCFSHNRSILNRDDTSLMDINKRYPPYDETSLMIMKIIQNVPYCPPYFFTWSVVTAAAIAVAVGLGVHFTK